MNQARLEHANITVADPNATAEMLCRLFGWKIRWQGPSAMGGRSVHVGNDRDYLAVYTPDELHDAKREPNAVRGGLNHIGVRVDDLDAA
jgi:catechol 2,3-dioxygenase-like lactoylglutathione lyase family enzyme